MFSNSFGLSLMSEGPPTCRQCEGKFGSAVGGDYCPLCSQLVQLAGHLLSRRFPVARGHAAVYILRDAYLRVLELSESYWGSREDTVFTTGSDLPPPVRIDKEEEDRPDKSWQVKEERRDKSLSAEAPGLSGKAAPVKPPSLREEVREKSWRGRWSLKGAEEIVLEEIAAEAIWGRGGRSRKVVVAEAVAGGEDARNQAGRRRTLREVI